MTKKKKRITKKYVIKENKLDPIEKKILNCREFDAEIMAHDFRPDILEQRIQELIEYNTTFLNRLNENLLVFQAKKTALLKEIEQIIRELKEVLRE
jgi:hypothetical protein